MEYTGVMDYDDVLHMLNHLHIVEIKKVPVYDKFNNHIIRTDKVYVLTNGTRITEKAHGG